MKLAGQYGRAGERGYAMAALLVGLSVMAVMMSAALPVWSHAMKREKEAELIWRGEQYKRAIMLYQRKYANSFPPTIDILVEQRFLRKKYKDPIADDDFQIIPVGGIAGGGVPGFPGAAAQPGMGGQPGMSQPGMGQPGMSQPGMGGQTGFGTPGGASAGSSGFGSRSGQPSSPGSGSTAAQPSMSFGSAASGFQPGQSGAPNLGIQGVTSKSKDSSIKLYNGMSKYNQWAFVALATGQAGGGAAGFTRPGMAGGPPGGAPTGGFGVFGGAGQTLRPGVPGGMPPTPGSPMPSGFGTPTGPGAGPPGTPGAPPGGSIFTPVNPGGPVAPKRPGLD